MEANLAEGKPVMEPRPKLFRPGSHSGGGGRRNVFEEALGKIPDKDTEAIEEIPGMRVIDLHPLVESYNNVFNKVDQTFTVAPKTFKAPSNSGSSSDEDEPAPSESEEAPEETTEDTPLQQKKWTQTPPPKPRPSNARLPQQPAGDLAKAREVAEKFKPKQPSRLREVAAMSPLQLQDQENRAAFLRFMDTCFEGFDPEVLEVLNAISDTDIKETIIPEEIRPTAIRSSVEREVDSLFQ
jgi:hypothetical protein